MTPYLDDGDVRLFHGDALETLRSLPDGSVDCVVTSPPYWGLRDYGTGEWDGGDPGCDHKRRDARGDAGRVSTDDRPGNINPAPVDTPIQFRDVCGKCGATRVDQQMGLEPTPDLFVHNMVELFREVRRVLADHGTCWVNLGDSYAGSPAGNTGDRYLADGGAFRGDKPFDSSKGTGLKPKDLCGVPWRVAFALQADGWWLRSDIIWAKPNPMPESVTDRPTKAHEYVFLLTKQPRYWFDTEAVREQHTDSNDSRYEALKKHGTSTSQDTVQNEGPHAVQVFHRGLPGVGTTAGGWNPAGRNVRSVWNIATQPYPEAHFATFPEELARRCILAGCPVRVCRVCGKPSERIVEATAPDGRTAVMRGGKAYDANGDPLMGDNMIDHGVRGSWNSGGEVLKRSTVGWSDCGHNDWRPGVVLDPFIGSGTTAKVARDHQRHAIGIDLNQTYLELAARRLQQLSLLTEAR